MKWILLLIIVNITYGQSEFSSVKFSTHNSNISEYENEYGVKNTKKVFTDIRLSVGGGIGIFYGNMFTSLNIQSLLSKNFNITAGFDYYFIKDKEEKRLKNLICPSVVIFYNVAEDTKGNELLFGGGLLYLNFKQIRPIISLKGNLYLKNSFYLGLELRQPFLDGTFGIPGNLAIFISPYIGFNLFYKIKN